jgi:hypothetical protein
VRIRALTLHGVLDNWLDSEHVSRTLRRYEAALDEIAKALAESGIDVWTKRISLPPAPASLEDVISTLQKVSYRSDVFYSLLHVSVERADVEFIRRVLDIGPNVYVSIHFGHPADGGWKASELLYELAKLGLERSYRYALTVPGPVETPYFPAATTLSSVPSISVALLYPKLLEEKGLAEGFAELMETLDAIESVVSKAALRHGLNFAGFDLALSPWMEESVTRVIEKLSGRKLGDLGISPHILEVEEAIRELCDEVSCTGFNQLMLAVAEDDVLKERVREGSVRLSTLASYMYACVSGIDMVVVPAKLWTRELAEAIIKEVWAASYIKSMPLGIRVIVAEAEPGDDVELGRFGRTPVIGV